MTKQIPNGFIPPFDIHTKHIHPDPLLPTPTPPMVTIMSEPNSSTEVNPLHAFRIANLPPDFYYIPNFITAEEEGSILGKVRAWFFWSKQDHASDSFVDIYDLRRRS